MINCLSEYECVCVGVCVCSLNEEKKKNEKRSYFMKLVPSLKPFIKGNVCVCVC